LTKPISENRIFLYTILLLAFLHLTFDYRMSLIYIILLVCDMWWYNSDDYVSLPTERTTATRMRVVPETLFYYALFLISSIAILTLTRYAEFASFQGIARLMSTSVPMLQGSKIFTWLSWGLLIPLIETRLFFGRIYEGMAEHAKSSLGYSIPTNRFTVPTFVLIIFVSIIFTLFHIGSKGLSTPELLVTFSFAVFSLIFVTKTQELKGPILKHVLTNSIAVFKQFGWF